MKNKTDLKDEDSGSEFEVEEPIEFSWKISPSNEGYKILYNIIIVWIFTWEFNHRGSEKIQCKIRHSQFSDESNKFELQQRSILDG